MSSLEGLLTRIRQCELCEAHLPLGPRPVVQASSESRILLVGQAPGRKVHASGKPFDDASGDRLRAWLGVSRETFYDAKAFAIAPMGFCYPGTGLNGDLPPRPECAPTWRPQLLSHLEQRQFTLLIGRYAIDWHCSRKYTSVREAVADWETMWPAQVALPHPSPRNNRWLRNNPWFEAELVPRIRERVQMLLGRAAQAY